VLVVSIHLAVTVSGFGSWYFVYSTHLDTLSALWFAFYQSFTQGYFLGLLFMISGYFVAGSYDRKGFGGFTGDRFKRLVIPTLIFMIAIDPFTGYIELGNKLTGFNLINFLSATGPMWFAAALFGFSLIYALKRLISRRSASDSNHLGLTSGVIVSLILIIAVFAFLIRIVQPIGTSILNFQLCYFSSYIVLFIVGIIAYRNNWFAKISYRAGKRWIIGTIGLGFLVFFVLAAVATATGTTVAIDGGLTWQSAAYSVWESSVAVLMSFGLIAVFREKFNRQSKLVKTLSDNSFAVYMFHPMIIIPITLLLTPLVLSQLLSGFYCV
jgi:surface polysaccharide O-acyltransferase-like enzyme